jgi:hypothetical protein
MAREIFEFFLRLTLHNETISLAFQFPDKITDKTVIQSVPKFCFPEGSAVEKEVETEKTESFSFVSTLGDGSKRFGYCRRFFKPNKPPECYCLLSYASSFSLFSQVLDIVELKFMEGDKSVYQFLHSILAQPFPDPGQTIQAQTFQTVIGENGQIDYLPETFRLTRSNDDYEYLEYVTYEQLFRSLDVDKILLIFECLLNERRILVVAKNLSTLTSCMDAISNMAYPFAWQYVFIPILPKTMLSFLGAPMPFLMGILSTCLEAAMKEPMEEGVLIVDIDHNDILQAPDDLPQTMPYAATEKLRKTLKNAVAGPKRNMEFSIDVAHAFLKFWASIFGNYAKYFESSNSSNNASSSTTSSSTSTELITTTSNASSSLRDLPAIQQAAADTYTFNFERFIKSKPNDIKKFLLGFKEYQLFHCFMQERETWLSKGLLNFCIILRAQNAKKKDSIAAVKAKLKSQVGRVLAAWNESSASSSSSSHHHQSKKEKQRAITLGQSQETIASQGLNSGELKDSMDTSNDSSSDVAHHRTSPLQSDTTESDDRADSSISATTTSATTKGSSSPSSNTVLALNDKDRPRAATMAPVIPPKPKSTNSKKPTTVSPPTSSKGSNSSSKVAPEGSLGNGASETASSKETSKSSSSKAGSSSKGSSKDAVTPPKGSSTSGAVEVQTSAAKPIPFGSRFTFKPTPLLEGSFEEQIWKLCNVESLADSQLMSNEKRKYWIYSPVLFQRLPELSKIPKPDGHCIPLPLGDDAVESLMQWVYSDEIFLESADSALELLCFFPTSESRGSAAILRQAIVLSVLKHLNQDNVLHHLKVFSSSKASTEDSAVSSILNATQLMISKFSPKEMNAMFRRQLSSVSHLSLAAILHMKMSASARLDAEASLERVLRKQPSSSSLTPRSASQLERKHLIQDMAKLLETRQNADITLVFASSAKSNSNTATSTSKTSTSTSNTANGSSEAGSSKTVNSGLEIAEETIKVHSKVLAARSLHLHKMLGLNLSSEVKILNVSAAHFKQLLPYIYTGQLQVVSEDRNAVFELVQAAHVLDLDTLAFREALYASLATKFTTSSVFDFLDAPTPTDGSLQHPAERAVLVGAAAYFLAQHPTIFYRPEKLKSLEPDVWECIFKFSYANPSNSQNQNPSSNGSSSSSSSAPVQVEPEERVPQQTSKAAAAPSASTKDKKRK